MTTAEAPAKLSKDYQPDNLCRILALDGGGAKGFYTLGVLKEIEAVVDCPLYKRFYIIIRHQYRRNNRRAHRARIHNRRALGVLSSEIFATHTFENVKTQVGIIATRWLTERPMIFKAGVGPLRADEHSEFSLVTATAKFCGSLSDADRDSRSASVQWCAASVVNLASVAM